MSGFPAPVNPSISIHRFQRAQHVVKGTVLHHEHNDVFEAVEPAILGVLLSNGW